MIEEIRHKRQADGSKVCMSTYANTEFKGPFLSFIKHENNGAVTIEFGRSYAEDSKYADRTYMQLVTEALEEIGNSTDPNKTIYLNAWGKSVQVPRGVDAFELQQFISNFIIENADLSSNSYKTSIKDLDMDYKIKTEKNMFYVPKPNEGCIDYIQRDFENTTNINFGKKYSRGNTTYMQMVVEALSYIDEKVDSSKTINVDIWNGTLQIPRDADKYEIQELLTNFILKNATFDFGEQTAQRER